MLDNYKYLDINIPYYDYIRASIFVQDFRDNFGEEVSLQFNEAVLIWILYDDFLNQIKKGTKNENMFRFIIIQGVSLAIIATSVFGYTVIKGRGKHASKTKGKRETN